MCRKFFRATGLSKRRDNWSTFSAERTFWNGNTIRITWTGAFARSICPGRLTGLDCDGSTVPNL
jgi:hypothetical protein